MAEGASGEITQVFSTLGGAPDVRGRQWFSFGLGVGLHLLAFGVVFVLGILAPAELARWHGRPPVYVDLRLRPEPSRPRVPRAPRVPAEIQAPKLPSPRIEIPELPPPKHPATTPNPDLPKAPVHVPRPAEPVFPSAGIAVEKQSPPAPVRTGEFGGSSTLATLKLPAREVQTGGFGSPNGFPGEAQGESFGNMPTLGSFDLPVGPGHGNGLGGSRGARGTVASAGFGSGPATGAPGAGGQGGGSRGSVRSGAFDVKPAAPVADTKRATSAQPLEQPVEILSKPNPAFTQEARSLGIQGEVVLAVVFTAEGKLRVLRVVQGLGHGLDESAWRAAEQIRFKPAMRDGEPIDFPATLRVLFQLSG
jgi:TonB family protein